MRRRMLRVATALLILSVSLVLSGSAQANHLYQSGALSFSGANEVPPNGSTAIGTAHVTVDTDANTLSYDITYSGLSSTETAAHIHGFAAAGANAAVLTPLPAGTHKVGVWNFSEPDQANILAGLTYFNIHSVNFGGGEIRAQIIVRTTAPGISRWGLLALALLLAGSAAFVLRRRGSTAAI